MENSFFDVTNRELGYYDNLKSWMEFDQEVEDLLTLPFNDLKWLMAQVKEKLEKFLEVENDQHN